ncbi:MULTISPECIES: ABC transporter ATP-binding protein [unclassified Marinobacterium]|jgi:branched-chain amino acid transport system ATP-binding protein|uniref:ABC transporter ATP-binding protein n=1 Tax=unclassified Marinobacterium TaxID=2644139 RepID=UPI001569EA0C|nr:MULTISPECIES: ABC transporter ATP-binding protein [unclassified Marinobacterium]NRP15959.1 Lipopolysaccharide export system ATP-binding protein LptB [Marinobacterium sp. xm-a-152]NRP28419.1 Lipopolysaccharide export system ATP-binding protein LptB [Marinobacterium sp. xm-d-420]NRP37849.1 Lipopolysaccharide export system ATP-binding protein LptB [Marinobacterium sp. xm-a-121]NRP46290.1 Lipopolysaccharide export system ATP-binding protein LptB [Marinobacterium sp. xm-d-543]NRP52732.1 Lipopoly
MSVLEISGVNKTFGGLRALDDVNLKIEEKTVHAVIGPNGAGKSTLLNAVIGKLIPDNGTISFSGNSMIGLKPHKINQLGISRVFQTPEIFADLTIMENMMIPLLAHRDGEFKLNAWKRSDQDADLQEKAAKYLEYVNMLGKSDTHAGSMSRGDKRRLELAMCLSQEPKLLLLDEPTAGMARADTNNTIDLLKKIKADGMTMVIIEHDMHVVFSLADKVSVMAAGHVIVEGSPDEIKVNPKVREAYLGGAEV